MTMLLVTHEVADQIVFLVGGQLMEDAPPAEFFLATKTQRAKGFVGRVL